jgi:hypothetical protein
MKSTDNIFWSMACVFFTILGTLIGIITTQDGFIDKGYRNGVVGMLNIFSPCEKDDFKRVVLEKETWVCNGAKWQRLKE